MASENIYGRFDTLSLESLTVVHTYQDLQHENIIYDKKVSNTWYFKLRIYDHNNRFGVSFVFRAGRFSPTKRIRRVLLYISSRPDGAGKNENLLDGIDLRTIGSENNELAFGVYDKSKSRGSTIKTETGNIRIRINKFIEQILNLYFDF